MILIDNIHLNIRDKLNSNKNYRKAIIMYILHIYLRMYKENSHFGIRDIPPIQCTLSNKLGQMNTICTVHYLMKGSNLKSIICKMSQLSTAGILLFFPYKRSIYYFKHNIHKYKRGKQLFQKNIDKINKVVFAMQIHQFRTVMDYNTRKYYYY